MSRNDSDSDKVTFQVTVDRLTLTDPLSKQDIRATICVDDKSKITCSGEQSEDGLTVTWDHPFLFSASPSTVVVVAIHILPEELTPEWDKQPLGDQVVTDVAKLSDSENRWECNVTGLPAGSATLSMIYGTCDVLIVPSGHDCLSALTNYASKLYEFGEQFQNVACCTTNIEVHLARLDLCPLCHADHVVVLSGLADAYMSCYKQGGNVSDLNKAVEVSQTRLDLCPLGHPEHAVALGVLAYALWNNCIIQGNQADLTRVITMAQELLDLCPPGHSDYTGALGILALFLDYRYYDQGDLADLNMAIKMEEERLHLCPPGHPEHDIALTNLAASRYKYYQEKGDLTDLDRAIELNEMALNLCPENHPDHGLSLKNLAMTLQDHFKRTKNQSDLTRAIKLFKEAMATVPIHHSLFALTLKELASALILSSNFSEAFETYRSLKKCEPAVSLSLWNASKAWVESAEKHNHPSVLEAYQTALRTLDQFTSLNSSLDSRHETMQTRVANLANDAFSCGTRNGDLQLAVEFLEQGRGILWNQLARFETSITKLESQGSQGCMLGDTFTRLCASLRKYTQGEAKGVHPYWRVQDEWQSVVDSIRRLDGFSRFLLPPHFDDLKQAAEDGPVIIVSASEYTCDALIVLHNQPPVHIPLPCSLADVIQLCLRLSELTKDPHAYGNNRESWVKQMLRELWSSVVEPIAAVLQKDLQVPQGSRIWWCPTSKFTVLPLHAAGPHRKSEKNMTDIYVSSYTPSLSALIRTRARVRSQETRLGGTLKTANMISFAAVGQSHPSADLDLLPLPEVELEIQKIRDEADMPSTMAFERVTGAAATIEGSVQAFHNHRWVHVACHGAQHAKKPFESWFAMRDGKLTLMRIIQERYTNSDFAFLSACHTAVGDASTPDEVLHLAAGMQFAGFNGVIGTLWRVDDSVAHQVVTRFYKEMFSQPVIDFQYAAKALNVAVVKLAEEVSLEKRIVFVHIGI